MALSKTIAYIIGGLGLALTIVPALMVFAGTLTPDQHKSLMALGMVLWFGAAFRIMKRNG
jgi:hypothetical protein